MRSLFAFLGMIVATFLNGCDQGFRVEAVTGVDGNFCVPSKHVVGDIPWAPKDRPGSPKGFAFAGCWSSDPAVKHLCGIPSQVLGGVVKSLETYRDQKWRRFTGSWVAYWPSQRGTVFEKKNNGRVFVVSNDANRSWYVWQKAPGKSMTDNVMNDDDDLLASCHEVKDVSLYQSFVKRDMISCRRTAKGDKYWISYSFESSTRAPENLEAMDKEIFDQVDRWRCWKRKKWYAFWLKDDTDH